MEDFFNINSRNRSLTVPVNSILSISNDRKEDFIEEDKLLKLEEVEINNSIKSIVCESKNLYSKYEDISDNLINFSLVNLAFDMIDCRVVYNKDYVNIYCNRDNEFLTKRISQDIKINIVDDINRADITFFENDISQLKPKSNLLLYVDIKKKLDFLISISKYFSYIQIYKPERQLDDKSNKIYIYLKEYNVEEKDANINNFLIRSYNQFITRKIDFYSKCIKVLVNKQYFINESNFNFITCEKILNLY